MRNKNNLYSRNFFNYEQLNEYSDVGEINNKEYKKKLRDNLNFCFKNLSFINKLSI